MIEVYDLNVNTSGEMTRVSHDSFPFFQSQVISLQCSFLAPPAGDKQAERIDDDIATLRKIRLMADSLVTPHPVSFLQRLL